MSAVIVIKYLNSKTKVTKSKAKTENNISASNNQRLDKGFNVFWLLCNWDLRAFLADYVL